MLSYIYLYYSQTSSEADPSPHFGHTRYYFVRGHVIAVNRRAFGLLFFFNATLPLLSAPTPHTAGNGNFRTFFFHVLSLEKEELHPLILEVIRGHPDLYELSPDELSVYVDTILAMVFYRSRC